MLLSRLSSWTPASKRLGFLAGALLLLLVVGSFLILSSTGSRTVHYRVATQLLRSEGIAHGELNGILFGQPNPDGTACFWMGDSKDKSALVWPQGYSAGGSPLSIFDGEGHRLGTVGQTIAVSGGLGPEEPAPITGCPGMNQEFLVGGVIF
jgi:hypothetical protein